MRNANTNSNSFHLILTTSLSTTDGFNNSNHSNNRITTNDNTVNNSSTFNTVNSGGNNTAVLRSLLVNKQGENLVNILLACI